VAAVDGVVGSQVDDVLAIGRPADLGDAGVGIDRGTDLAAGAERVVERAVGVEPDEDDGLPAVGFRPADDHLAIGLHDDVDMNVLTSKATST
jgi:hypothetical protein